ncbi:uncharacterized protein LOC116175661 [Photinus pyralis]|uniref:uncharacterized protein LOC116175661 n=1 Tax=Photinus pyralis TaxID=7054 RepID=UPI0012678016|nr:uncharacterized protein LOC116175661 [Photinus pyralis]
MNHQSSPFRRRHSAVASPPLPVYRRATLPSTRFAIASPPAGQLTVADWRRRTGVTAKRPADRLATADWRRRTGHGEMGGPDEPRILFAPSTLGYEPSMYIVIISLLLTVSLTANTYHSLLEKDGNLQLEYAVHNSYCPYKTKQEFTVMDFLGKFEDSLACVLPKGDELICVGDFNLDLCDTGRTSTFQFSNLLETLELKQIIDEPTRITKATATLIDFIIVPVSKEIAHHGVISLHEVTDHFLVFCNYPVTTKQSKVPTLITYNDFSTFSINNFDKDLQSIDWDYIYTCDNVEHMVDFLNYNILTIFDCHAPIKTVRVTKPRAPWLTDTIRQMILLRDKALMKFKKSKSCTDWNYYKAIRNYTTQAIRREKKAFLENQLQQLGKGVPWKNLRDLNVYSKDKLTVPPNLSDVNAINKVFTSSVDSDLGIASDTVKYYTEHTCEKIVSTLHFREVTEMDVLNVLFSIKTKSVGSDGIGTKMLCLCCPYIAPHLTYIINFCLKSCTVPKIWKNANVIPLPKVSNPESYSQLRPISILPILSKILEKIMASQIKYHLSDNDILPQSQSGFRENHSCSTALLNVTDDIFSALDQGKLQ